jgi:hypothetical protein
MRTVKSLLAAIRNFELSNSVRDQITEERRHNTNWQKDLNSSTAKISAQEKSVSFTFTDKAATARSRTDTERSDASDSLYSRSRTNTEIMTLSNTGIHLMSEMETFHDAKTTLPAKPIGSGNVKVVKSRHLLPRSKTNRTHH